MNRGYESIFIDATPPKKKSRYVNETCRVDSLFTLHCTGRVLIINIVDLYF